MKHKLYKVKAPLSNEWEYVLADNQTEAINYYCDHYCDTTSDRTRYSVEYVDYIIVPPPYVYK